MVTVTVRTHVLWEMMITTVSMSPQNPCLDLTAFVAVWMYGPLKKRLGHKGSALVNGLLSLSLKWDSDKMVSLPGFLPFHPAMMQHKDSFQGLSQWSWTFRIQKCKPNKYLFLQIIQSLAFCCSRRKLTQ
jgi:hypothetical protein